MMQDVTHIRSLQGSRRLLNWDSGSKPDSEIFSEKVELNPKMKVGELIGAYPFLRDYLVSLNSEYKKLKNPILYATMKKIANLEMLSEVGGYQIDEFINILNEEIKSKSK